MKTLLFILFLSLAHFAQDLPDKGSIDELKGKTKAYLIADNATSEKHIMKQLVKSKTFTVVKSADDAEFFIEYRTLNKPEPGGSVSAMLSEEGQMDIFYKRGDKKVIVWSDVDMGGAPYRSLARKAVKALAFK